MMLIFMIIPAQLLYATATSSNEDTYFNLNSKSSDELIRLGVEYIKADSLNDMAVATLTIVANRYYENMNDTAARNAAAKALNHLGNLYMTHDIEYRKAYKSLVTARQIAEEDNNFYQLAHIYNGLANLYYYNADGKEDMHQMAYDFMNDAADAAMKSHNETMIPYIALNMAIITYEKDSWGPFEETVKRIMVYSPVDMKEAKGDDWKRMRLILSGVDAMYKKNHVKAERDLNNALKLLGDKMYTERNYFTINYILIHLYDSTGQLEKATTLTKSLIDKAIEGNLADFELSMYAELAMLYEKRGMADSVDAYYNKYLKLENYFQEHRGYKKIETLDLRSEMERINREVEQLSVIRQKEKRQRILLLSILIIVTVICLSILWVYLNLRKNHMNLYRRNEEMTKQQSMHRMMREKWEKEKAELIARIDSICTDIKIGENTDVKQDNTLSPSGVQTEDKIADNEDKSNTEDEPDREQMVKLFTRIIEVMESSSEIYKQKFALNDLSAMLEVTPRSVSRAINLCYNANFHQLLNDYRIREVSRIMHSKGAENLTIESLAEQGGFRSRTYFATVFKKATGLTPSEYLKMVKNDKSVVI